MLAVVVVPLAVGEALGVIEGDVAEVAQRQVARDLQRPHIGPVDRGDVIEKAATALLGSTVDDDQQFPFRMGLGDVVGDAGLHVMQPAGDRQGHEAADDVCGFRAISRHGLFPHSDQASPATLGLTEIVSR